MLKLSFLSCFLLLIAVNLKAQTIKEDTFDEFTKNTVKRTSWEPLSKSKNFYVHVRLSKLSDHLVLDLKAMFGGGVFSVKEGPSIQFKMDTDSIIALKVLEWKLSCEGCGAVNLIGSGIDGVELNITIDREQLEYLSSHKIKKLRIYTREGYYEGDIKDKFQDVLIRESRLIL